MDSLALTPLYMLRNDAVIDEETGYSDTNDLPSLYTQLALLTGECTLANGTTINLDEVFSSDVLKQMTTPFFGDVWPRPETGPLSSFIVSWGRDPDSAKQALPGFTFSMSDAVLDAEGRYSNLTTKENLTAKISLSKDTALRVSVEADPPLPNGASIEMRVNGAAYRALMFNAASPEPKRIVLTGYGEDYPTVYLLDFSLNCPTIKLPDNTTINVRLDPVP